LPKAIRALSHDEKLVSERRRQIIACAIDLFVKNGFDETTIADIASELGWSKGLIYHYVSNKSDVLYLIAYDQAEGTIQGFSAIGDRCCGIAPIKAVLAYIDYYYGVVDQTQNYQIFLNQLAARLPRKDRKILFDADRFALDVLDNIIKRGVKSRDFAVENTMLMAHNILIIGRVWADRRWFLQKNFTLGEYMTIQRRAVLRMLGVTAARIDEVTGAGGKGKA